MTNIRQYFSSLSAQEWKDERLTWDPQNYNNIQDIVVRADRVWTPELAIINGYVLSV